MPHSTYANADARPDATLDPAAFADAVRDARLGNTTESELPALRPLPAAGHSGSVARITLDTQIERV
jgi:hypothetical protein